MRRIVSCLALLLALATAGYAAQGVSNKEPLKVKSDTLNTDNEKKTATFEGKVVARQGDMTLYTDRMVVSYNGPNNEVSQVEAFGNVRIVQEDRQATGAHGVYDPKTARIVLDGNPKVVSGEDVVTGKVIIYYVNEQRSVVTSGPKERVEAVIHPGGKNVGAKP
ncbi:lipopolysaccharide transport periplasmic protein LptA [Geomonas sp. Red69]|uniref:lipopolysaccharide transport periplasmic protein LptA n=1 Tax=Geomonas diazotrophica TaxID=2843197 RepID=UPI001C10ABE8|nr:MULTISPECIES: lipopolysaccharide transport periplasmic protein LptA [Geomonas]MBU5638275.1 lipopolysaccharide transport periplasmic protein LptA [Geomonas diazotrophica]QXE85824.1 lipopolysaccharide transport periplasmic protein LptA [Geomonas nitrogeniifigens]